MTLWRTLSRFKGTLNSGRAARRRCASLSAAALALALTGAVATSPRAQEPSAGKLTTPLAVDWRFTGTYFGNNPAAPVITRDTAYFATGNHAYAVALNSGALKWRYPSDATATLPATVNVTPVLDKGTLYLGAGDGLYALNADDGKLLWHYAAQGGVDTTPSLFNDNVYFISGSGRIHGVNTKTGEPLEGVWKSGRNLGIDAGGSPVADAVTANGIIIYTTSNEVLHAIDLTSGIQRWYARPGSVDRNSVPVVSGESLILLNGNLVSSYRIVNGQRRWMLPITGNVVVPPAVDADGNVFIVTDNREVYSINSRGRGNWPRPARLDFLPLAAPVVADNTLVAPTASGGVYAFDTATGALKWNYMLTPTSTNVSKIPATINTAASPVVANGSLYVLSDDGALTAFRHDAPDSLPPSISELQPEQGDYLNGRPPFTVSAKLADEGSGLNLSTLTFSLDNRPIPRLAEGQEISDKDGFVFDLDTDRFEYTTRDTEGRSSVIPNGHHTAAVSVKDWMGNQLTKTWSFTIDDSIPRRAKKPATTGPDGSPYGKRPGSFPGGSGSYSPSGAPGSSSPDQPGTGTGRRGGRRNRGGAGGPGGPGAPKNE